MLGFKRKGRARITHTRSHITKICQVGRVLHLLVDKLLLVWLVRVEHRRNDHLQVLAWLWRLLSEHVTDHPQILGHVEEILTAADVPRDDVMRMRHLVERLQKAAEERQIAEVQHSGRAVVALL